MNTKLWPALIALCLLAGCVSEAIRRNDDRYLQPGALDAPIAERYDTYQYRFLDTYRVTHDWLGVGDCKYGKLATTRRVNRAIPALYAVADIFEEGGKTWQRNTPPRKDLAFDRYVRSQKRMVPTEYASVLAEDGKTRVTKAVKFEEKEEGFGAMCFEAWAATSHTLVIRLQKRNLETVRAAWNKANPSGR